MSTYTGILFKNGFLVTSIDKEAESYSGVDGLVWPLENSVEFSHQQLGIPYYLREGVPVATDWKRVLQYWKHTLLEGLNAILLLVETERACPNLDTIPKGIWKFVGYDVADIRSFHSVLLHEIVYSSAPSLVHWKDKLNANLLLTSLEEVVVFLEERKSLMGKVKGIETCGDFSVVRVSRYQGEA